MSHPPSPSKLVVFVRFCKLLKIWVVKDVKKVVIAMMMITNKKSFFGLGGGIAKPVDCIKLELWPNTTGSGVAMRGRIAEVGTRTVTIAATPGKRTMLGDHAGGGRES